MRSAFYLLAICLSFTARAFTGIIPAEGAMLNYRIIGCSFPAQPSAISYKIEIAPGNITNPASFHAAITSTLSKTNKIIVEVPAFGTTYTWRVIYTGKQGATKSSLYHFSTAANARADTAQTRLRITQKAPKGHKQYVIFDGDGVMYDTDGNPVWFLPDVGGMPSSASDIKYTPQHSLSLLYGTDAFEVNYNGKMVWRAPAFAPPGAGAGPAIGVNTGRYHHEFFRLANGHYMALGSESLLPVLPDSAGDAGTTPDGIKKPGRHRFFPNTINGILYEFDSLGNIVWLWKSTDYYAHSDINALLQKYTKNNMVDGHENSFFFDEKNSVIYISYLTYNRIVKISYPSGQVLNTYGPVYLPVPGDTAVASQVKVNEILRNDLFCGQHNCSVSKDGNLLLYNNNICEAGALQQVLMVREPPAGNTSSLKAVWKYEYPAADLNGIWQESGGGCVKELPDGSLFVLMTHLYGKAFIVTKAKKILWCATPEKKNAQGIWEILPSYRATVLSEADLHDLIWNAAK